MIERKNLLDNSNIKVVQELGGFKVLEHQKDLSVSPFNSVEEYFAAKMNVKKRQVLIDLKDDSYTIQAGAMQWMNGNISASSGVKGVGNFFGKMVSSAVTVTLSASPPPEQETVRNIEARRVQITITYCFMTDHSPQSFCRGNSIPYRAHRSRAEYGTDSPQQPHWQEGPL